MCGFTGFYTQETTRNRSALHQIGRAMSDTLSHRGPDSGDVWQDPDTALLLGHRRLAIIDLSPEGHQPMASASQRYMIAYNGEIYNFLDLRSELEIAGAVFRGRSDTEILLAGIELWGLNLTLQKINGMFAFALWDKKLRQLHLVRDRLGKKPLYVGWAGKTLVFGSELKALHMHPDFKAEIDPQALQLYLAHGYVCAPHAIYKNVWALLPGHRMILNVQDLAPGSDLGPLMEPYWHHWRVIEEARLKPPPQSDAETVEEFERILGQCVRERMISDVPLGAFLSGGIDSSTVVALMQTQATNAVKTYTIGFDEAGFNEAAHARKIVTHLGTDHHEMTVTGQSALDAIPFLPDIYDEPFADISAIPTYLVSKFARQDVTVALSGDGGDEMLGGYTRHLSGPALWRKMKMIPPPLRAGLGALMRMIPVERWDALLRGVPQFGSHMHKAAAALSAGSQEALYQRLIQTWDAPPLLSRQTLHTILQDPQYAPQGLNFAEAMMYWDALSYLPNDILVKVDRATMAVGLEARAPLLDKRIYDYVWRLPERYKIRSGQGKWLLRQVLKNHMPEALFERPKQGFSIPVGAWLRGPLKDWAETLLAEVSLKQTGLLNPAPIRAAWQAHLNGQGNHAHRLWTILMFQAWQKRWV